MCLIEKISQIGIPAIYKALYKIQFLNTFQSQKMN